MTADACHISHHTSLKAQVDAVGDTQRFITDVAKTADEPASSRQADGRNSSCSRLGTGLSAQDGIIEWKRVAFHAMATTCLGAS